MAAPTHPAGSSIPSTPDGDAAWTTATRASLAQADAQLAAQFDQGIDVDRLVEQRATAVDALIREERRLREICAATALPPHKAASHT